MVVNVVCGSVQESQSEMNLPNTGVISRVGLSFAPCAYCDPHQNAYALFLAWGCS